MRIKTEKVMSFLRDLRRLGDVATPAHSFVVCVPVGWPEQAGPLLWSRRDAEGMVHEGEAESLQTLPAEARDRALIVWTPGSDTLLTAVSLPTRSRSKILQALPFALEDQLLGEPESLEFTYRSLGEGRLAVAVTAHARIEAWRAALQEAGLHAGALCPITLALPQVEQAWSLAMFGRVLVVRTGAYSGFECFITGDQPPAMLKAALGEARNTEHMPERIALFKAPAGLDVQTWADALQVPVAIREERLATQLALFPPLNLLGGNVSEGAQMPPIVRKLRPAAIMFGIWVIAAFGFNGYEWWQLSRTSKAQRAEMTTLFQKAFPDAKVVVDPALQMQRNLADLQARGGTGSPGDFLPLLAQISPVFQANSKIELQGIQYAEHSATLDLRVPDFQTVEAISGALSNKGLQVSVVNSNSRGTGVETRLRVGAGSKL